MTTPEFFELALRLTLVGGTMWLVCLLLPRRLTAAVRHRLVAVSLVLLVLSPLAAVYLDGWKILPAPSAANIPTSKESTLSAPSRDRVPPAAKRILMAKETPPNQDSFASAPEPTQKKDSDPLTPSPSPSHSLANPEPSRIAWPAWLTWPVATWSAIVVVLSGLFLNEMRLLIRLRRSGKTGGSDFYLSVAKRCADSLGLRRMPKFRFLENSSTPMVTGVLAPTILLPAAFKEWPESRQRAVLIHELAHVKRRDVPVQLAGAFVCILQWFNPFAWLLLKRLRHEAECACDDWVLGQDIPAPAYAELLLAVASGPDRVSPLGFSMVGPSGLRRRVQDLLRDRSRPLRSRPWMEAIAVFTIAALCLPWLLARAADPAPTPAPEAAKAAPKSRPEITMTLSTQGPDGEPLGGVTVRGFNMGGRGPVTPFAPIFTITTDDSGQWQGNLPVHEYMILATKGNLVADYDHNRQTWWYLNTKTPSEERTLQLEKGCEVLVTAVAASTGAPVPGAKVILNCGHTGLTDASGQILIPAVPKRECTVKVISPPLGDLQVHFNSTGQDSVKVEARMDAGYQVKGRVLDSQGQPVRGALVRDYYSGKRFLTQMNRHITGPDGAYQLGWYSRSRPLWSFGVEHKDFAKISKSELTPPAEGDTAHWDFILVTGRSVSGAVTNEAGEPIANASVRCGASWSYIHTRSSQTDAQGHFTISGINPEGYNMDTLVVEASGYAPQWRRVEPGEDGNVTGVECVLEKGATVKGRIVDRAGKPVKSVSIAPSIMITGSYEYVGNRVGLDAQGNFELTGIPDEGAAIDVVSTGFSPVRRLEFKPGDFLDITLNPTGVILGHVVDATTGQPVTKFNVRLDFPKAERPPNEPQPSYSATLSRSGQDCQDEQGRFTIDGLIAGAGHAVTIQAEGYAGHRIDKVLAQPADDKSWPLEIKLDPGIPLSGKLVDATSGNPVAGAKIYFVEKEEWYSGYLLPEHLSDIRGYGAYDDVQISRSDSEGNVDLHLSNEADYYTLIVTADGYAPQLLPGQPASQRTPRFQPLQREAKLTGTAAGLEGVNFEKDFVQVRLPGFHSGVIKLTPSGTFETAGLPSGKAWVCLQNSATDSAHRHALLDFVAGETATVNFATHPTATLTVHVTQDNKPAKNAKVSVWIKDWAKGEVAMLAEDLTPSNGILEFTNLPLCEVQVNCDSGPKYQAVDLTNGEPARVEFEVKDSLQPE